MQGMNNVALNNDAYEHLQESCEKVKFKEPEIDIEKDMQRHVDTLKRVDESIRKSNLTFWITTRLKPRITQWKQRYAGCNNILNTIHTQMNNLDNLQHSEQININNIENQITTKITDKSRKKIEIENLEQDNVNTQKIDIGYEKKKAAIFIIFSIIIAFATYTYFIDNQISLKWATKTSEEKADIITELVREGDVKYINYLLREHKECLRDEDTDKVFKMERIKNNIDLSCIDTTSLQNAPKPNMLESFSSQPILFILAFTAFLLLLMGKVTAIVYEKMDYPNWMFYLFYGLAGIILISTAIISSQQF